MTFIEGFIGAVLNSYDWRIGKLEQRRDELRARVTLDIRIERDLSESSFVSRFLTVRLDQRRLLARDPSDALADLRWALFAAMGVL